MANTILLTGFPGFLGTALLPRILKREKKAVKAICLVQPKVRMLAEKRLAALIKRHPDLKGRVELVPGDISLLAGRGLKQAKSHAGDIREIYHFAAVYDLSVDRLFALRVNVDGTANMLELAEACPRLKRFHYVSTCYVSGRYAGPFYEKDLDMGQRFDNAYEETKFLAEVDVQDRIKAGLPATIYRPAIVVGDSQSGWTQKYDGPYYVMQWLMRHPTSLAFMPVIGDPERTRVNVVPSDYILDAMEYLSGREDSVGETYQLSDPNALTVDELLKVLAHETGKTVVRIPLPYHVAKAAINYCRPVDRLLRIPASTIDYFIKPTHFVNEKTAAILKEGGIECPPFDTYARNLAEFMRRHPRVSSRAMA